MTDDMNSKRLKTITLAATCALVAGCASLQTQERDGMRTADRISRISTPASGESDDADNAASLLNLIGLGVAKALGL